MKNNAGQYMVLVHEKVPTNRFYDSDRKATEEAERLAKIHANSVVSVLYVVSQSIGVVTVQPWERLEK